METRLLPAQAESIHTAADLLRQGEVVAFPTETVYGLGADAFQAAAVQKIFLAKGRPTDNPLIVHIAAWEQLERVVSAVPPDTQMLMEAFWPGPLTLIFKKSENIPDSVTAGGKTVAVRWPDHQIAQRLILAAETPIAAPSANMSGRPSPTTAEHVLEDLNGKVPLILDGGPTPIGVESTVLDVTEKVPILLRAGGIDREDIENVLHKQIVQAESASITVSLPTRSPGTRYRHYAPNARVVLVGGTSHPQESIDSSAYLGLNTPQFSVTTAVRYRDSTEMMQRLFHDFRELDKAGISTFFVEVPEHGPYREALLDRVTRASQAEK